MREQLVTDFDKIISDSNFSKKDIELKRISLDKFIEDKDLSGTYYIEQFVDKIFVDVQYAKNQSHAKGFHFISKGSHLTFKYWPDTKIFQETFLQ